MSAWVALFGKLCPWVAEPHCEMMETHLCSFPGFSQWLGICSKRDSYAGVVSFFSFFFPFIPSHLWDKRPAMTLLYYVWTVKLSGVTVYSEYNPDFLDAKNKGNNPGKYWGPHLTRGMWLRCLWTVQTSPCTMHMQNRKLIVVMCQIANWQDLYGKAPGIMKTLTPNALLWQKKEIWTLGYSCY